MVVAAAAAGPVPTQSNRETKLCVRIVVIKVVATYCVWWRLYLWSQPLGRFRRDDSLHTRDQDQPGLHFKKKPVKVNK